MPRSPRTDIGGYPYHIINRAIMRLGIFNTDEDYLLFEQILTDTANEVGMRIFAYALMPNHWHLLLYPENDGDLSLFMHRLTNAHTRKVHTRTGTIGTGPLYQGRYKSFLIEEDRHLLAVLKYVERNPVRAKLVPKVESWRWGSAWRRLSGTPLQKKLLTHFPVPLPTDYQMWINTAEATEELKTIRTAVNKGTPFGKETWIAKTSERFGLTSTLRNPGRPKK